MIRGAVIAVTALVIATMGLLAPDAVSYRDPVNTAVWNCFVGPIQGGNDELDSAGMGAPVTWGRECQGPTTR